jgi:hypothetical protein
MYKTPPPPWLVKEGTQTRDKYKVNFSSKILRGAFAIDRKESSKLSNDLTPYSLYAEFTYKAKGIDR